MKYNEYGKHGTKIAQYLKEELIKIQHNKCCICEKDFKLFGKKLGRDINMDHNHNNGEIRGLLCYECNILLGRCNDNIDILKKAIKYIETDGIKDTIKDIESKIQSKKESLYSEWRINRMKTLSSRKGLKLSEEHKEKIRLGILRLKTNL